MAATPAALKWSGQYTVATTSRLQGDKITLPPSALEALLAAAPIVSVNATSNTHYTNTFDPFNPYTYNAERQVREQLADRQQQLPHPLTFRLVNPDNGRIVFAGIREFSAQEGSVGLSQFLRDALGLPLGSPKEGDEKTAQQDDEGMEAGPKITVHAQDLPKGSYVRLRPLEAGYDPEDWKSLLERYLRDNFTTLTNGELLTIQGGRNERFRFLVDKFEPEGDGICIIDTDLEVDIEALNEEQARETLKRKLEKSQRAPGTKEGSSEGGKLVMNKEYIGQILPGEYVDFELRDWGKDGIEVQLQASDEADLDLFLSPFSPRQRAKPRDDEHVLGDFDTRPAKRLRLQPTNVELEAAEAILISVHAYRSGDGSESTPPVAPHTFSLKASSGLQNGLPDHGEDMETDADEVKCKNCQQLIPKRTMALHEAFCYRNNILCPQCKQVFQKRSSEWQNHWHCPHDSAYGNDDHSHIKHDTIYHPINPYQCPNCEFEASTLPELAQHRSSTCPGKEILCQFCHLVVPQQSIEKGEPSFTDPEVLLSGLTPHELADGARTTECHLCSRIVRLRDMKTHLKHHDMDRMQRPLPHLCSNAICGRTIADRELATSQTLQLGLCNACFGPLYAASHDPEGKALRRRIERRLLQQLMAGCGKPWCANEAFCRTGRKNQTGEDRSMSTKDALPIVKPVMDRINGKTHSVDGAATLAFCVDETNQRRRLIAEMLQSEGQYELEWCVKALEESQNDLGKARDWLADRAPKIGEKMK